MIRYPPQAWATPIMLIGFKGIRYGFAHRSAIVGIGATTAMFSAVDTVLLLPLRFRASAPPVEIYEDESRRGIVILGNWIQGGPATK